MKELTVDALYTLEETIAKDIFAGVEYPWEVLPKIHDFILELGSYYGDWIRTPGVAICSCNDGLRPVIFKMEATDRPAQLNYTPV